MFDEREMFIKRVINDKGIPTQMDRGVEKIILKSKGIKEGSDVVVYTEDYKYAIGTIKFIYNRVALIICGEYEIYSDIRKLNLLV